MRFLLRLAFAAFGLWLAQQVVPGIRVDDGATLAVAALLLGFVNAVVRPVLVFLTLPITILTLGLFLLVINAGTFALVAWLLEGFRIPGGFLSALLGAAVVSVAGWIGSWFLASSRQD